ncbi:MAG: cytochrome C oxidase subunit IV family protein, partial [Deltaproteobacteria bacterium]|nr:cytochrome C oxidase subunit IV family protein [Deltaproteobacteria bacterium]
PYAIAVALLVATIKGSLVASYFMHLISEKGVIYGILAFTLIFFVALLFIPMYTTFEGAF